MTNDGGGSDDGLHIARDAATIMAYTCRGYVDNESIMGWFGRERAIFFFIWVRLDGSCFWTNKELQEMVMKSIGGVPVLGKL